MKKNSKLELHNKTYINSLYPYGIGTHLKYNYSKNLLLYIDRNELFISKVFYLKYFNILLVLKIQLKLKYITIDIKLFRKIKVKAN